MENELREASATVRDCICQQRGAKLFLIEF